MLRSFSLFSRELLANPRNIGAACPSSPALAGRIAKTVRSNNGSYVIEVGAGTGSITAALLKRSVAADRLIVLEQSPSMVRMLRSRFPHVNIVQGDAGNLDRILEDELNVSTDQVSHVVSSLPLKSIPERHARKIANVIQDLMQHGSKLVQYTYDLRGGSKNWYTRLGHVHSSFVWLNLPPARVDLFTATRS